MIYAPALVESIRTLATFGEQRGGVVVLKRFGLELLP